MQPQLSTLCCVVLLSASCGVQAHPHAKPELAGDSDFAPTSPSETLSNRDDHSDTGVYLDAGVKGAADASSPDARAAGQATDRDAQAEQDGRAAADGGAATLMLGDATLRKEDVLAFIHFGHSNMSGAAADPAELLPYFIEETHPRVWMYRVGMPPKPALEPTAREDDKPTAGPGVALLKQAAELAPNKYFMSLAWSRGGVSCVQFTPGGPYFAEVTKSAVAIKDRVTFAAIVVMLGIVEGLDEGRTADTLSDCFVKLANGVRQAVGRPDLPILFSDYEAGATGVFSAELQGPQKVIAELAKVPDLVPNSAVVSTKGVAMQDDHHFNLAGYMLWTKRVLDIMQAKGWFPWAETATSGNP